MQPIVHWTPSNESPSLQADSIHIWRIDLGQPADSLTRLLSTDETEKAQRLISQTLRQRYTVARAGMRHILGCYLGIPGDKLQFGYGTEGKPTLQNCGANIQFNLSHCGEMALLALSTSTIGIDLEKLQQRPNLMHIAQRLFPQTVQQELAWLHGEDLTQEFFHHWTALESCAKCHGVGIFGHSVDRGNCHTRHFTPEPGWVACVATESPLPTTDSWMSYQLNFPVLIK